MTCRICLQDKPLIKAHIIPESFFPKSDRDERPSRLLTDKEGEYPKKMPIGVYDRTILCLECEKQFDKVDNYAQKILLEHQDEYTQRRHLGTIYGYEISTYDYNLLKSFFVSLLWRASVSTHPFYSRIKLGPYEPAALETINSEEQIPPESFSVILAKFDHPIGKSMLNPHRTSFETINFNQFYLGGYIAYIKTDQRPIPNSFSKLMLTPNQPLRIIGRDFLESKELPLLERIARAPHNRA